MRATTVKSPGEGVAGFVAFEGFLGGEQAFEAGQRAVDAGEVGQGRGDGVRELGLERLRGS